MQYIVLFNKLTHKYCSKCDKVKFKSEFHINRINSTGLYPWCKICKNTHSRKSKTGTEDYTLKGHIYNTKTEKYCPGCKTIYPLTREYFSLSSQNSIGFRSYCIICNSIRAAKRAKHNKDNFDNIARPKKLKCNQCKILKLLNNKNFKISYDNRYGFRPVCRLCFNENVRNKNK